MLTHLNPCLSENEDANQTQITSGKITRQITTAHTQNTSQRLAESENMIFFIIRDIIGIKSPFTVIHHVD